MYQVFADRLMKKNGYHVKNLRRFRVTGMQKDKKKKEKKKSENPQIDEYLCKLCFYIIALTTFQVYRNDFFEENFLETAK